MAFAIRNVPDRGAALRSIAAHLRDGARLVILELSQPSFRPARWVIK
jgi:ubiquinone/menaquinone biosynthesis C-methylase UbiE